MPVTAAPTDMPRFVGRVRELDVLRARLEAARAGHGSLVALTGEPGIGKTRTAQELVAFAGAKGFRVLWGRCFEGDWSPPYAPWVEALETAVASFAAEDLRAAVGAGGPPLAQLVPTVREAIPDLPAPATLEPREEQFRLYDATVQFLLATAGREPILLVLDDIHWADRASLGLLSYLARFVGQGRLLVVGTYRDLQLDHDHPLTDLLGALRRERSFQRLRLRGLNLDEVSDLATAASQRTVAHDLARLIHEETNGNPFFIEELLRYFLEEGRLVSAADGWTTHPESAELGIPDGVREVVGRRLARLSPDTARLLTHAAACTGGFDFAVLAALTGLSEELLLDSIDEALDAHLIEPVGGKLETYDFVHAIVRHALYEGWSPSRLVRLHRQLAEALEHVHAGREMEHAAELAAQYHASATLPGAERGLVYALAAANQARKSFSQGQAVTFLRMARDLSAGEGPAERAEIRCTLAIAETDAMMLTEARASIDDALVALEESGASPGEIADYLATAATALHDSGARLEMWRPLVDRGLAVVPAEDELTWARLALMVERFEPVVSGKIHGSRWLGTDPRAVAIARSSGDEALYARSLQGFEDWSPERVADVVERARTWKQPPAIIRALIMSGFDGLYFHSDFRRAIQHYEEMLATAERFNSILGHAEALVRLTVAHLALGNMATALDLRARAADLVTRLGPRHRLHASVSWNAAFFAEYLDGDWTSIADYWRDYVSDPELGMRMIGLDDAGVAALANVRAGRIDEAREILELLPAAFAKVEPTLWLLNGAVTMAGSAAWTLGAVEFADAYRQKAIDLIEVGQGDFPCTSNELTVARMAALLGRDDEAAAYFERARAVLDASGQRPLRGITDFDEAQALIRTASYDRGRVERLLASAGTTFRELGMEGWARRAAEALAKIRGEERGRHDRPAGLTDREIAVLRLVVRGYSDRQIGEELFVSPRTVNAHIRNMLGKTMRSNRTELSVWAVEHDLAGQTGK